MLFGLSPALFRLDESLSTLRFAMRAKKIQASATLLCLLGQAYFCPAAHA